MKKGDIQKTKTRENEKGAAVVMVILISFLLLVACAGVLLESSMNSANVTDAVAEQQAYYAAESGIQSSLNVLRGNTDPLTASTESEPDFWASVNPLRLIETTASASASPSPTPNKIDFRKAVTLSTSNYANDPSDKPRLSRWLNYNYTSPGKSYPDRVKVGAGNDNGFSLSITDPDRTGEILAFRTDQPEETGGRKIFYDKRDKQWKSSITIGTNGNTATFSYTPHSIIYPNNLDVSSGSANTNFGSFKVSVVGSGVTATNFPTAEGIRFQIIIDMTAPYTFTREIRGWIKPSTVNNGATVTFDYDSKEYDMMGSRIILDNDPQTITANGASVNVSGKMTQTEPTRLIVRSTGYGPRGAKKELETVVQKNFFNGMTAPATLTLVGPPQNPQNASDKAVFLPGTSAAMEYSGKDVVPNSNLIIPPIGTTNEENLETVLSETCNCPPKPYNGRMVGTPSNVEAEMPYWLQSPKNLDETIRRLRQTAESSGRLFTNGQMPSGFGDNLNARGITFIEGNATLGNSNSGQAGGGILVVTGKLTLNGKFNFNGLIIVTGAGGIDRQGAGNGIIQGNVVVAPYNKNNLGAGFLPPKYDLSGGGASDVVYNSSSIANGMIAVSNFVLGVVEK
jgi:hypothetical protein